MGYHLGPMGRAQNYNRKINFCGNFREEWLRIQTFRTVSECDVGSANKIWSGIETTGLLSFAPFELIILHDVFFFIPLRHFVVVVVVVGAQTKDGYKQIRYAVAPIFFCGCFHVKYVPLALCRECFARDCMKWNGGACVCFGCPTTTSTSKTSIQISSTVSRFF